MSPAPHKTTRDTKQHILRAARQHFEHYGFAKATMDEIAGNVGMGKASLYYYFPTKERLFQAVMIHEHDEFLQRVQNIIDEEITSAEKIRIYVRERFEYFGAMLNLNILDLRFSPKTKPLMSRTYEEFAKRELKILRSIIHEGSRKREFVSDNNEKHAEAFLHVMQGLRCRFLRSMQGPKIGQKDYDRLHQEIEFVTELLLCGIRRNEPAINSRRKHLSTNHNEK